MSGKANAKKKVGTATKRYKRALKSVRDKMTRHADRSTGFLESLSVDLSNAHADAEQKLEEYRELLDSSDEADQEETARADEQLDTLQDELTEVQIQIDQLKLNEAAGKISKTKNESISKLKKFDPQSSAGRYVIIQLSLLIIRLMWKCNTVKTHMLY